MDSYGYPYPSPFPPMRPPEGDYPDHGDGFGDYYGLGPLNEEREIARPSRSTHRTRKRRESTRSLSRTDSVTKTRSRSRSRSRSRTRSRSRSRSRTRSGSRSHSRSGTRNLDRSYKEPGFLDAFRVLYLTPSKSKKSTTKYLVTKKRQDRIQELLKSDGLGSKRWLFYPRTRSPWQSRSEPGEVAGSRDNCDQRVKIDGDFFRKYKRRSKVDADAPIAKLKRWELIFYKKLGFIQAV